MKNEIQNEVNDVAAEYAQAAVQALHMEDLLGHIPVIKNGLAAAKVVGSLRDHLLLRKIGVFLHAISVIPAPERRAMVSRLEMDQDFDQNLGEHLIELLDRVDGVRKPAMIGAVFAAFAFDTIGVRTMLRLNSAIQYLPAVEIAAVRALDNHNNPRAGVARETRQVPERESMLAIANAGLAEPAALAGGIQYHLNETGSTFLKLELDLINPSK